MRSYMAASVLLLLEATLCRGDVVYRSLRASLDTGSLGGTRISVSFSYEASEVAPENDSFVSLKSFDFTLLGVPFHRSDIFQGGQAIFRNGVLRDVTASFQVLLPGGSPVNNITFGFGGDGVIGYIDHKGRFGRGHFTFGPAVVHSGFISDVRRLDYLDALGGPGIEIELYSDDLFPVRDQILVLQIGRAQFLLSRYPGGDLHTVAFALTLGDYASLGCLRPMIVQYGTDPSDEIWDFGDFDRRILRKPN